MLFAIIYFIYKLLHKFFMHSKPVKLVKYVLVLCMFFCSFQSYSASKTYYEVLNVPLNASILEIKQAYKKLASKHHPDRNSKGVERMKEINLAYQVLKNPNKRQQYDRVILAQDHDSFKPNQTSQSYENIFSFKDINTEAFQEDIFNTDTKIKNKDKMLYLFRIIVQNSHGENLKKSAQKQQDKINHQALKFILQSINFDSINVKTRNRILADFTNSLSLNKRKKLLQFNDSLKDKHLENGLISFIENIKTWYSVQSIQSSQRKAIEIFHTFSFLKQSLTEFKKSEQRYIDLLKQKLDSDSQKKSLTTSEYQEYRIYEKRMKKDLKTFKKVLQALGIPYSAYNDIHLRVYLEGLKKTIIDGMQKQQTFLTQNSLKNNSHLKRRSIFLKDADIFKAIQNIKITFDNSHYENLKLFKSPFSANFLKSFPAQFLIFQMAIGASIYRQGLTSQYQYDAQKHPGMFLESMGQSLSPSGILSFAIFISVSQYTQYRLYGLGRVMDGKSLKTPFGKLSFNGYMGRSSAPALALAAGFFISSLFDDLLRDENLKQCAKNHFSTKDKQESRQLVLACEAFYIKFLGEDKWKHYAVDIGTLIGSSVLSHKLIQAALTTLTATRSGSKMLLTAGQWIGRGASMWLRFFANIYAFVEIHSLMDHLIGKPVKEYITSFNLENSMTKTYQELEDQLDDLNKLQDNTLHFTDLSLGEVDVVILNTVQKIKKMGHKFQQWIEVKHQDYYQSVFLWTRRINDLLSPYEGASKLLKDLFVNSHLTYTLEQSRDQEFAWDSNKVLNSPNNIWLHFNNQSITFSFNKFRKLSQHQQDSLCENANSKTMSLEYWPMFCQQKYLSDNLSLVYETAWLINEKLSTISALNVKNDDSLNIASYIDSNLNNMLSAQASQELVNFSIDKKFKLAKTFIEWGLQSKLQISDLPIQTIQNWKQNLCASWFAKDLDENSMYHECQKHSGILETYLLDILSQKIHVKLISIGIFLWKKTIKESLLNPSKYLEYIAKTPKQFLFLLEVYKKGESYFLQTQRQLQDLEDTLDSDQFDMLKDNINKLSNPYKFTFQLICPSTYDKNKSFVIPQFFKFRSKFYDSFSKKFIDTKQICTRFTKKSLNKISKQKIFHEILFHSIVKTDTKFYENLYLSIEDNLKNRYSSSQKMSQHFQKLSQDQLDYFGKKISTDLKNLTDKYYKNMIQLDNNLQAKSLKDFDSYYHNNRIDKNKLFSSLHSFTNRLQGLEISLFQIQYWMTMLKQVLHLGDQTFLIKDMQGQSLSVSFNKEFMWMDKFDIKAFESMQFEVLSLLQSYHDSYKQKQGPYLAIPDQDLLKDINDLFINFGKEELAAKYESETSRFSILKKYQDASQDMPIFMSSDIVLSHVLKFSVPGWNQQIQIQNMKTNPNFAEEKWEKLVYSIFIELNKSLTTFFYQTQALHLKESFDNKLLQIKKN